MFYLYMKSKFAKLKEIEQNGGCQKLESERNGEMLVKEYKLPVIRRVTSGDLMYSTVIIVNKTVFITYLEVAKRVNVNLPPINCHHTKKGAHVR